MARQLTIAKKNDGCMTALGAKMLQCDDCGMDKSVRCADQFFEPIENSHMIKQIDWTECSFAARSEVQRQSLTLLMMA